MQKHFNEKYMESELYSMSTFKGSFLNEVSLSKNQLVNIESVGVLNIHGIDREVIIKTDLIIKDSQVDFSSEFEVLLKDYKIKIPKIVMMNIADTILVNVSGKLISK